MRTSTTSEEFSYRQTLWIWFDAFVESRSPYIKNNRFIPNMTLRSICSAKIHRATITDANIDYIGSILLPPDLMDLV